MQKINVTMKNCYGIRALDHQFDFSKKQANLIYAPNGMMKTSFALAFKDHSEGIKSKDRIYPSRVPLRLILDENQVELSKESIFVVEPYDSRYESGRVSSLLVNRELKEEYDNILKEIDKKSGALISQVKKTSGIKSDVDEVISQVFTKQPDNLLRALDRVKTEVLEDPTDTSLKGIQFTTIFNDKVEKLLSDSDIKEALETYTATYDDLISKSRFFKRGVFNHYQASEIARQLKTHGFFKADHRVFLNAGDTETAVQSEEELELLIEEELAAILSNSGLKEAFDKIDKKMSNQELRAFREFLLTNQTIIPRLQHLELLKEDLLKYYLMQHREMFSDLMNDYSSGKKRLDEIAQTASEQATRWQDVINIFNRRFSVPFKVVMQNKQDVILKRVTPNFGFTFEDELADPTPVERDKLLEVLSNGERRALYILNVIFEVQARIEDGVPTLFIIDDIADSFDYKNKYAIIEYLVDVLNVPHFRQIILTHNYDFYRTVWNRLQLGGANFHVAKTADSTVLTPETMYKDPFERWKKQADSEEKTDCLLAMIPFVRNLAEYCGYNDEFDHLTTALHIKPAKPALTLESMLEIFSKLLNGKVFDVKIDKNVLIVPLLISVAEGIAKGADPALDLEKKVVLSIAIRLLAERYMITKINDAPWVEAISSYQTSKLVKRFKEVSENDASLSSAIAVIDRVNLMTPENIHLNSFMYEPILDMSSEHLKALLADVSGL